PKIAGRWSGWQLYKWRSRQVAGLSEIVNRSPQDRKLAVDSPISDAWLSAIASLAGTPCDVELQALFGYCIDRRRAPVAQEGGNVVRGRARTGLVFNLFQIFRESFIDRDAIRASHPAGCFASPAQEIR